MDITVSRLNKRMALQLPAEFPLGLVFVVGEVKDLSYQSDGLTISDFVLKEEDHHLHCRLSPRAAIESCIGDGDLIRAGGHLAFSPAHAGYYLLARDIEVLSDERQESSSLVQIIVDNEERTFGSQLEPAKIPQWVELLAPPEVRSEIHNRVSNLEKSTVFRPESGEIESRIANETYPAEEPVLAGLSDELIDFLSEAMDEDEDIELTPELLAEFEPAPQTGPSSQDLEALKELEAALFMTIFRENSDPTGLNGDIVEKEDGGVDGYDDSNREVEETSQEFESAAPRQAKAPVSQSVSNSKSAANPKDLQPDRRTASQVTAVTSGQGQPLTIPWYVVAGVMAVVLLFVAAFVVVALSSTTLPLPISLP